MTEGVVPLRTSLRGGDIAVVGCEDLGQSNDSGHSEPGCPFPDGGGP